MVGPGLAFFRPLPGKLGPQRAERGAGLLYLGEVEVGPDPEDEVACFDVVAFLGADFHYFARDVGRDLDFDDRADGSRSGNGFDQVAPFRLADRHFGAGTPTRPDQEQQHERPCGCQHQFPASGQVFECFHKR